MNKMTENITLTTLAKAKKALELAETQATKASQEALREEKYASEASNWASYNAVQEARSRAAAAARNVVTLKKALKKAQVAYLKKSGPKG